MQPADSLPEFGLWAKVLLRRLRTALRNWAALLLVLPWLSVAMIAGCVGSADNPDSAPPSTAKSETKMIATITEYYHECIDFYCEFFVKRWQSLSPIEYGSILIGIGVVGFLFMKSGNKR